MTTKVVYLLGAGATQAELAFQKQPEGLLMDNILQRIVLRVSSGKINLPDSIRTELRDDGDLEELISLCENAGSTDDRTAANALRKAFQDDIGEVIKRLGPDFEPSLAQALLEMHKIAGLNEQITAILTTNYDDFIERAAQKVLNTFAYGINVNNSSSYLTPSAAGDLTIIKLHGSFIWENKNPVSVVDHTDEPLWIPPGSQKSSSNYPFSLLWGKARETLDCDVLRIIGSSLTQHDWHLISLVFLTQKLRSDKRKYDIEVIAPLSSCKRMIGTCQYLKINHACETDAMKKLMLEDDFPDMAKMVSATDNEDDVIERYDDAYLNPFESWLKGKGLLLEDNGIRIEESECPNFYKVVFS